ncbi:MAG TPA: hypothetical protein VJ571_09025 [Candidatus Nitrosotalea sp.]|nr:hypothetical protein [Candidatus Nitrosotalea sp.]
MKYWYLYIGVGIAAVIIGSFLIFQLELKRADQNYAIPSSITNLQTPTNDIAKAVAEKSVLIRTILTGGDYQYEGIFYSGNHGVTFVNVVYQSNHHITGPLIVTEDANSTKILSVEIQPAKHHK